jgi:hypothetical protein
MEDLPSRSRGYKGTASIFVYAAMAASWTSFGNFAVGGSLGNNRELTRLNIFLLHSVLISFHPAAVG